MLTFEQGRMMKFIGRCETLEDKIKEIPAWKADLRLQNVKRGFLIEGCVWQI